MDFSPALLILVISTFFIAGGIKGIIGVGLPTISIAILINFMPLQDALPLIVMPAVISNIVQALSGGQAQALIKRFWLLGLLTIIFTWIGVGILAGGNHRMLTGIFGCILTLYALTGLLRPALPPPGSAEKWLTPLVGIVNGLINGLTGSYMMPSVIYLQALGLRKDELVQAMGLFFVVAGAALGISLAGKNVMNTSQGLLSAIALIPALIGYYLGQIWRKRLSEERFRKVFFTGLLWLGLNTILRIAL